jgi:hypothetical protein
MPLLPGEWIWTLAGAAICFGSFYALQVSRTWLTWRSYRRQAEHERKIMSGRVTVWTAAEVGVISVALNAPLAVPDLPADELTADLVRGRVEERARLRWALRHPLGGPLERLGI